MESIRSSPKEKYLVAFCATENIDADWRYLYDSRWYYRKNSNKLKTYTYSC